MTRLNRGHEFSNRDLSVWKDEPIMLNSETKRRIYASRDIFAGKLLLPTDQAELVTFTSTYKFIEYLGEQPVGIDRV